MTEEVEDQYGNRFSDEGDVTFTDPYGNPILEGETQNVSAGGTLRSEWLRGVANGDFGLPSRFPDKPLNSDPDSIEHNPLPGWNLQDGSQGRIKVYWREDTTVGSQGRLDFEVEADAPTSDSCYVYQMVPIRATATRNSAVMPLASVTVSAYPDLNFRHSLGVGVEEFDRDGNSIGLEVGAGVDPLSVGFEVPDPFDLYSIQSGALTLQELTYAVKLSIGIYVVDTDPNATVYGFQEAMLVGGQPMVLFPDLRDPTKAPGVIRQEDGNVFMSFGNSNFEFEFGENIMRYAFRNALSKKIPFFMGK